MIYDAIIRKLSRGKHLRLRKNSTNVDTSPTLKFEYKLTWNNYNYHTMKYKSTKMNTSSGVRQSLSTNLRPK